MYLSTQSALETAKDRIFADYRTLINDSRNFEDVLAVWPEVEALRGTLGVRAPTAIMRLGEDVIARIRADVATRQEPHGA